MFSKRRNMVIVIIIALLIALALGVFFGIYRYKTKDIRSIKEYADSFIKRISSIENNIGRMDSNNELVIDGDDMRSCHMAIRRIKEYYESLDGSNKKKFDEWLNETYDTDLDTLVLRSRNLGLDINREPQDAVFYEILIRNIQFVNTDEVGDLEFEETEFLEDEGFVFFDGLIMNKSRLTYSFLEYEISVKDANNNEIDVVHGFWSGEFVPGSYEKVETKFKKMPEYMRYSVRITKFVINSYKFRRGCRSTS